MATFTLQGTRVPIRHYALLLVSERTLVCIYPHSQHVQEQHDGHEHHMSADSFILCTHVEVRTCKWKRWDKWIGRLGQQHCPRSTSSAHSHVCLVAVSIVGDAVDG